MRLLRNIRCSKKSPGIKNQWVSFTIQGCKVADNLEDVIKPAECFKKTLNHKRLERCSIQVNSRYQPPDSNRPGLSIACKQQANTGV
jgi:hypothetical protein